MVKVSVIGCGNLGVKIAGELAYHGHEVRVYDKIPETLDKVQLKINEDKRMLCEDGILSTANFVGQLFYISQLEDAVKTSDFIFESVPEKLPLKQELFEWISQYAKPDAIVATSALTLPIDDIATRALKKERCLGVRFLFPVYCIPEVEMTVGKHTSVSTVEKVRQFLARMGKIAFLRSGADPFVLSDEQRESKRIDFIRNLQNNRGSQKYKFRLPDLSNRNSYTGCVNYESETPTRDQDCVICMDEERNCVLHPCHHLCTCCTCGRLLLKRHDACPICRKHITSVFRVFHS